MSFRVRYFVFVSNGGRIDGVAADRLDGVGVASEAYLPTNLTTPPITYLIGEREVVRARTPA